MDLLKDDLKKLYLRFLLPSLGSAMVMSIYTLTDAIVIGKGGQMLKRIGTSARIEIENLMDTKVNLKLWVKVRKEWRDSELYMKNYGYNSKDI